jgi:hypothetical protein
MILDKKTLEMISVFEDGVAAMRRGMEYLEELLTVLKKERTAYEVLNELVDDRLELSTRVFRCLASANIRYIGELVQKTDSDLLKIKTFGRKSHAYPVDAPNRWGVREFVEAPYIPWLGFQLLYGRACQGIQLGVELLQALDRDGVS